ncbi:MAG: Trk system potassium transporter TrkA [Longimicrobiales bacterium]|nr:Trk system potassium transporter TrkA [Longimicrobiales bacterium]
MRIIIVGAGEVGFHLAERLSQENQDVALIESDPARAEYASNHLDVLTVTGNGASLPVLERAGIRSAQILLAVTSRDEVNLIACLAASRLDVKYTIARISNPEYYTRGSVLSREHLGIDLMINPERECALEAFHLLRSVAATDVAYFAEGRVQLMGLVVKEGSPVDGKTLAQLGQDLEAYKLVTAAIVRDGETTIPGGADRIRAGDQIFVLSSAAEATKVPPLAGYESTSIKRVMIAGGSPEGEYLAQILGDAGIECTILDRNRERCVELAEALPKALVLHGDATDLELLEMEGVGGIDGFVSATGNDDTNLLTAVLAKNVGARKVLSLIDNFDYLPLITRMDVDAAVSARMSTVNAILRYVRRGRVMAVATLKGIEAEAIHFDVTQSADIVGQTLEDLEFPESALVGAIIREDEVIIPRGRDRIKSGDEVIVFALPEAIPAVESFFE